MIDTVNANSNVTKVYIEIRSKDKWNYELLTMMNRLSNVNYIYIADWNK